MAHWRALQVKTSREHVAEEALAELNIPVVLPKVKVRLHRRGSPVVHKPLFPGYLFADLPPAVPFGQVKRCKAVIDIIGTIPIPTPVIDAIAAVPENVCFSPRLVPGYTYRLRHLHDALAKLETLDDHGKAKVILRMFGVERAVTVSADDLEEQ